MALERLGIDRSIKDPEGGYFERDDNGELTGWVYDTAFDLIRDQTVDDDVRSLSNDLGTAIDHMYSYGIAGAHTEDMSNRSEEHTSELQSRFDLVCRLLLDKK